MELKKKILIHNVAGAYGGSERTMEVLLKYLSNDFEIWVAGQNEVFVNRLASISQKVPIMIVRLMTSKSVFNVLFGVFKTIKLCRAERFAAVIANTNKSGLVLGLSRLFLPKEMRILIFIRDFQWTAPRLVFRLLGKRGEYFAPSKAICDLWPATYGPKKEVRTIPSPVDVKKDYIKLIPDCLDQESLISHEHFASKSRNILVLGSISRLKGIGTVVGALAHLKNDFPDLKLNIVGKVVDSAVYQELKDQIQANELETRVTFVEHVDAVEKIIGESFCVISATIPKFGGPETFGRTIIEAWAQFRPVIASRCGGPRYLIDDGVDGLLFEPGDHLDLARAIQILLKNPTLSMSVAVEGRKKLLANFTAEKVARMLVEEINSK